uniref:Adenosine 3'-phospho 5'-phosphosulfate transporter 1 n=1 Tax=Macrostomum lignano TaxID=282301 RepID=A0A1I8HRG0_9PLAT
MVNASVTRSSWCSPTGCYPAGLLAVVALRLISRTPHRAPAFEYTWSSLSNVLSSWCQYEALLYVSFPTQVLAKACKIIPVMLMGKLVSRKSYRWDEYATAALISAGTSTFLLASESDEHATSAAATTLSGAALLAGYMAFDAFTSTWQSVLFTRHGVTTLQMMAGTSVLSCVLTVAAQLEQGSLPAACASTIGQLVIFQTIARFGSVTFIIIMTVRQAFAILLSCLIYQHRVPPLGYLGVAVVFWLCFLESTWASECDSSPGLADLLVEMLL